MTPTAAVSEGAAVSAAAGRRGLKVVCVGGGTGLSTLLAGLKAHVARPGTSEAPVPGFPVIEKLTAVVTVSDDGGSSGRLRREFHILPPGDIRNCIAALSEDESLLLRLFEYRFAGNGTLGGHSFGNLLLTALTGVTGDFVKAVRVVSDVLAIRGTINPSTRENVHLLAELEDGSIVEGETLISQAPVPIRKVRLEPADCRPLPETLEAIRSADLVALGPGSLYTSIAPNLLVQGVAEALRASKARRVYISNLMTQAGETRGFSAARHAEALRVVAGDGLFDTVLVNSRIPPAALVEKYRGEGAEVVRFDAEGFEGMHVDVVCRDLMSATEVVRHDPQALAREVLALARSPIHP